MSSGAELRRAARSDIPNGTAWDLQRAWEIESARIESFIDSEANRVVGQNPRDAQSALSYAETLWSQIANKFPEDIAMDPDLLSRARSGQLQRDAGSWQLIQVIKYLSLFVAGIEVSIFLWLYFAGEGNWVVVLQGFFLAVAAFLTGYSLAERLNGHRNVWWAPGVVIIGLVTYVRAAAADTGGWVVFAITLALAILIITFQGLYGSLRNRYDRNRDDMFRAQVLFANDRHNKKHQNDGQDWKEQYRRRAADKVQKLQQATSERHGADGTTATT